jgi:hypothetical protein
VKVLLMYRDRDFELDRPLPPQAEALIQDLALDVLFEAMAGGDEFLRSIARVAVLASLTRPEAIAYRQDVLRDCLEHPDVVRAMYSLTVDAIAREKKIHSFWVKSPESILSRALGVMWLFIDVLKQLRVIAEKNSPLFRSEGFVNLFDMLTRELNDEYLAEIQQHLDHLRFRKGILMSARLGKGNKGDDYVLLEPRKTRRGWRERLRGGAPSSYAFQIADRDEAGWRALGELRARGVNLVANALAQSVDHVHGFLMMLRAELGFYVGCLNLCDRLTAKGEPFCFPVTAAPAERLLSFRGLYDPCLSLQSEERVVGNDAHADGKSLIVVTGANRGGKSTFLRSLGLAQVMMQAGMVVPAMEYTSSVCGGIFTHFKREEDVTMTSGKLDEELRRMSEIADRVAPGDVVLLNESLAATNEREGSQIASQVISALVDSGIRVWVVTHLYELARGLHEKRDRSFLFLRAERRPDGVRTFRITEGEPLPTSYGRDLYERVLGAEAESRPTRPAQVPAGEAAAGTRTPAAC